MIYVILIVGILIFFLFSSNKRTEDNKELGMILKDKDKNPVLNPITVFDDGVAYIQLKGVQYYMESSNLNFELGEQVFLIPEPDNPRDKNAIKVITENGQMIGHVSRFYCQEILDLLSQNFNFRVTIHRIDYNKNDNSHLVMLKMEKLSQEINLRFSKEELDDLNTKSVKRIVELETKRKEAFNLSQTGLMLEKEEKLDAAIKSFEKAIKLPNAPGICYKRLAINYRKRRDYLNEIRVLKENIIRVENSLMLNSLKNESIGEIKERIKKSETLLAKSLQ